MVANRVLAPRSKRAIMSWLETVAWPGEGPPELHHLYRSLDVLADAAAAAGWRALVGEYRPTERNGMVAEHYPRLGFEQRSAPDNATPDASFWRCELASRLSINHHIQVQA